MNTQSPFLFASVRDSFFSERNKFRLPGHSKVSIKRYNFFSIINRCQLILSP